MKLQLNKLLGLLVAANKENDAIAKKQDQLLESLKLGDETAVAIWFNQYSQKLVTHISYKVDSPADVDDLVQETFLNCLKHLPLFRGQSSLWTWMKRIANHQVADFYRKKYAKKAIRALSLDKLVTEIGVEDSTQLSLVVHQVLDQIREDYKELLLLKYDQGWSVQKIADYLERSIKSVEADLYRARREFKLIYLQLNKV